MHPRHTTETPSRYSDHSSTTATINSNYSGSTTGKELQQKRGEQQTRCRQSRLTGLTHAFMYIYMYVRRYWSLNRLDAAGVSSKESDTTTLSSYVQQQVAWYEYDNMWWGGESGGKVTSLQGAKKSFVVVRAGCTSIIRVCGKHAYPFFASFVVLRNQLLALALSAV